MSNIKMWMVRAGEGAYRIDEFKDKSVVAIGWGEIGELDKDDDRDVILNKMKNYWPDWSRGKLGICAGQVYRFKCEINIGDRVLTYDPSRRIYLVGTIKSDYEWAPSVVADLPNIRHVNWEGEVSRDLLSVPTKNVLGAISTLFVLTDEAADEVERAIKGEISQETQEDAEIEAEETDDIARDLRSRSREFIKDKITKLEWQEMQELVAGLLRAMGYKTRISPIGPDRGKDIIGSPDGFGFESPRIVVEVKHRPKDAIGATDIRSFLGGRHHDDKGLYVSTGGFTKDARYEADRAAIPLVLLDLDDFVKEILRHYNDMDMEAQALIPLTKIYWPI